MKERIGQIKEFAGKLGSKTKKIILAGTAILLIGAVALALILNNRPYEVLFSGLGAEEAQQITQKLGEEGIDFKVEGDSTILVKEDVVDITKAKLVQEGYPKSGFTYETYSENAGMLTTDSDKKLYELYQLQDRIGSTIRLFEGVKDAKVTIALGEQSKYALNDENKEKSSATAVITMYDGGSPTEKQARGIQRLIAQSVPNMDMEDVAVFDGNGVDVSITEETAKDSSDAEELAQIVENQVAQKVERVLEAVYGEENVRVSARAKINMEKLIRESTTYSTPEKIDEKDKAGIVSKEDLYTESSASNGGASGVAGTETNSDTGVYNTDGDGDGAQASSESVSREYLVNQIKEQGQVDPGMLDDLTVSVVVNGSTFGGLREAELRGLIANASGIAAEDQETKISVASAPFYTAQEEDNVEAGNDIKIRPTYFAIGGGIMLVLIIIAVIILLMLRKKRKAKEEEEELAALQAAEEEKARTEEVVLDLNKEIMEMQNDRGMELKKSIREFADQNPEISAQLLRNWLNGGGGDGE